MTPTGKDKQPDAPPQRRGRPETVGRDITQAARNAFVRTGFTDPTLVLRWTEIAGPQTARIARPIRFSEGPSGGVLTLKAEPAAALFLQHESRSLCERINAYLGRPAVAKLRFVQGPLVPLPAPPTLQRPVEPPASDPARRWRGPEGLGNALLNLARMRGRGRNAD
jgi:hypothetical protein